MKEIKGLTKIQNERMEGALEMLEHMLREYNAGELKCGDGSNPTKIFVEIVLDEKNRYNDINCVIR